MIYINQVPEKSRDLDRIQKEMANEKKGRRERGKLGSGGLPTSTRCMRGQ